MHKTRPCKHIGLIEPDTCSFVGTAMNGRLLLLPISMRCLAAYHPCIPHLNLQLETSLAVIELSATILAVLQAVLSALTSTWSRMTSVRPTSSICQTGQAGGEGRGGGQPAPAATGSAAGSGSLNDIPDDLHSGLFSMAASHQMLPGAKVMAFRTPISCVSSMGILKPDAPLKTADFIIGNAGCQSQSANLLMES